MSGLPIRSPLDPAIERPLAGDKPADVDVESIGQGDDGVDAEVLPAGAALDSGDLANGEAGPPLERLPVPAEGGPAIADASRDVAADRAHAAEATSDPDPAEGETLRREVLGSKGL